MKIGTIGYSNASGLGVILKFFRKHLMIDSQLVVSWEAKGIDLEDIECKYTVTPKENPSINALEIFIEFKPDVVLIVEYPFCWDYLKVLKERGIRIVYISMLDSIGLNVLEKYKDFVDLWLCVNKWSYELIKVKGWKCYYLPYPIDTDYFEFKERGEGRVILHNVGYGGVKYRKGSDLVVEAFKILKKRGWKLIMNSQEPLNFQIPKGIDLRVENFLEVRDLYKVGDLYLAPSRKEGLGLPIYEAMACGFPVVTTNAPPMNEIVQSPSLLIDVLNESVQGSGDRFWYEPSFDSLLSRVSLLGSDEMKCYSRMGREFVEENLSWNVLKLKYLEVFQKVINGEKL